MFVSAGEVFKQRKGAAPQAWFDLRVNFCEVLMRLVPGNIKPPFAWEHRHEAKKMIGSLSQYIYQACKANNNPFRYLLHKGA